MLNILVILICLGLGTVIGTLHFEGSLDHSRLAILGYVVLGIAVVAWARGMAIRTKRLGDRARSDRIAQHRDTFGEAVNRLTAGLEAERERARVQSQRDTMTEDITSELDRRLGMAMEVRDAPLHNIGLNIPIRKTEPPWTDLDPEGTPLVLLCREGSDDAQIYVRRADSWSRFYPSAFAEGTNITVSLPGLVDYLEALMQSNASGSGDLAKASARKALDTLRSRAPRIETVPRAIRF